MNKFIVIKFAELFLKGKNQKDFIKVLEKNVIKALQEFGVKIVNKRMMMVCLYDKKFENEIINTLSLIPGISYFSICYECKTNMEDVENLALNLCKEKRTFKIELKRKYKKFKERDEIIANVAKKILSESTAVVDVKNPEIILNIEIEDENNSFIWTNKFQGCGGLPVGINGKCLSLLSGGIDSPVASFLVQKRGQNVDYITFITEDVTDKTINKLTKLINQITLNQKIHKAKMYVVDFTKVQHELMHAANPKYRITLMRRSFYRIAQEIAISNGYQALVCGDNLGQVASQTIESINTISNVCNKLQIFRPLLTYDKQEIIKIAKKIGTYDISISEHEDVCSMFAPENPVTKPSLEVAISLENDLQLLNYIEKSVIDKIYIIEIK